MASLNDITIAALPKKDKIVTVTPTDDLETVFGVRVFCKHGPRGVAPPAPTPPATALVSASPLPLPAVFIGPYFIISPRSINLSVSLFISIRLDSANLERLGAAVRAVSCTHSVAALPPYRSQHHATRHHAITVAATNGAAARVTAAGTARQPLLYRPPGEQCPAQQRPGQCRSVATGVSHV